jgi:hypothetical protein
MVIIEFQRAQFGVKRHLKLMKVLNKYNVKILKSLYIKQMATVPKAGRVVKAIPVRGREGL